MQASVAVRQLTQRSRARGAWLPLASQSRGNSFIKQVMDQVKRDMEKDEKLKKDWEKVQKTTDRFAQTSASKSEKFDEKFQSISSKTSELLSSWKDKAKGAVSSTSSRLDKLSEENEAIRKARETMKTASESTAAASSSVFGKTKETFSGVMDASSKAFSVFSDEDKKAEKTKQWKAQRDAMAAAEAERKAAEEAAADKATAADGEPGAEESSKAAQPPPEPESALVVSKARTSSWERFGMNSPFLNGMFENPLFDRMFGESEIAASIREMKEIDYQFHLEEFAEDMEYVVAPHIIKSYLEGDSEALEKHCGDAAFAAVNAGIKERKRQKMSLDTAILAGPKEVELKGAKLMEQGAPCFIWTFNMQQVNCLRDSEGEIIEGAVDDIRTVCYAMAVTRHPNLDKLDLEYPWQVSELAILWNQPCF
eukprot:gb/GFBE01001911.1/.p1 GENE.gb/GFBE01001911.1/~~gb/GFBE01001911.1/.p1  ORF type:complete len:424 (+),score=140.82 gb/GFBE01001911.1/:1-1272(+)